MKTILIIDDNNIFLENLSEFFEIEGYKTLISNNGKHGVQLALEFKPDIIICDVLMPEMTGHQVLDTLLASSDKFDIPFIFSTSLSETIDRIETLKLGADDYLVKPYDLESLLLMTEKCIKNGSKRNVFNS
jgi:DNA-binding response OmpR family regulator